jgi:hypothetical protein
MQSSKPIPKFTSFRPKAKQEAQESEKEKPKSSSHKTHHKKHDHSKRHHSSSRESKSQNLHTEDVNRTKLPETDDSPSFISDRRGDPDNIRYGTIHRYAVPSYNRTGYGKVLGSSSLLRIDRLESSDKYIVLSPAINKNSLTRDKKVFAKIGLLDEYRIRSPVQVDEDLDEDFVPFRPSKRRKYGEDPDTDSENDALHYRSIEGKAKASQQMDTDVELNVPENKENFSDEFKQLTTSRTILSKKVEQNPNNGQAWLDLINHHDKITEAEGGLRTYAEHQSAADIKLSMYEKALKHVTGSMVQPLVQGLLKEAALLWDSTRLAKKWKEVLTQYPRSIDLWIDYLNYVQSKATQFRYDDLKTAYSECLNLFGHSSVNECDAKKLIYIILRFTLVMREAGFVEQATASWQALLEYNFRKPTILENNPRKAFEDFWDSEVPRIGEKRNSGWLAFANNENMPTEEKQVENIQLDDDRLSVLNWAVYEEERSSKFPARTLDGAGDDDPFRVVLYSDIETMLIEIPPSTHRPLINAFLLFYGMPPIWPDDKDWTEDPFIRNEKFWLESSVNMQVSTDFSSYEIENLQTRKLPFDQMKNCRASVDTLFADPRSFLSAFTTFATCKSISMSLEWLRTCLRALAETDAGESDLAEYFLAFELYYYPDSARKTAKTLLKRQPSNLRLYNTYALIEYRLEKPSAAENVLTKAMQLTGQNDDIILLKRTLAWESLGDGKNVLEHILDGSDITNATVFENQRKMLAGRDQAFANGMYKRALAYIDCLVLLTYCSNSNSLETSLAIFKSNIDFLSTKLAANSHIHEQLHQTLARLIEFHLSHSAYKPSMVRSALHGSINEFPSNTIFLSLFVENEARSKINDRVRSVVQDILSGSRRLVTGASSLVPHLFAIHNELARSVTFGSNVHSARSAFERGVADPATMHNTSMWLRYFEFELSQTQRDGLVALRRARDIFYRAIAACPWVKMLYVLPFTYLQACMNVSELRSIYELMVERELRVCVSLGKEFWEKISP